MKYRPELTQELLKQFVHYDPDTGVLKRTHALDRGHNRYEKEFTPTSVTKQGYRQISLFKRPYTVHRLAWFYMTGEWPDEVDHISGDRLDNRWCNLRSVSSVENRRNMGTPVNNKTGVTGVFYYHRYRKYEVSIQVKGERVYLGRYDDFNVATAVRKDAEFYYRFHENHGGRESWRK